MIRAIAITGPTASGKTALSISVAKALGCEAISLDSMQIYKGMDIGTAKATADEQAEIPHHMIDFLAPDENFSAKAYRDMAMPIAAEISSRGKIPLFVGGTGLYLSTLMRPDCEEAPESDPEYRKKIESGLQTEEDKVALWERLNRIDPESAAAIHYNNTRRVIRALEIYDATGKTKTYFDMLTKQKNDEIDIYHITLDFHSRDSLYERVNRRVDIMLELGLIDEIKKLLAQGYLEEHTTAAQAIGYKEILDAIRQNIPISDAIEQIKQASRNYAKRQLTWFRHDSSAHHIYADLEDGKIKASEVLLDECLILIKNNFL